MGQLNIGTASFPKHFEPYVLLIKVMLSPARFQHSLEVAQAMQRAYGEYCPRGDTINRLGKNDWVLAGLLHDVLHDVSVPTMLWWIEKHAPDKLGHIPDEMRNHPVYMHGPAGSAYASVALGIRQPEAFFDAIAQHAGNYPKMSILAICLHVADMTAPVEKFKGCGKLASFLFRGRLLEAELLLKTWTVDYFQTVNFPIHPHYYQRIAELTAMFKPGPNFFSRDDP